MTFKSILDKYRRISFSERDKGARFERLIQAYLRTDPAYAHDLIDVWLWEDFPSRKDFGGKDIGIDLVARTITGDYWAIQCKCYAEGTVINKAALDSFITTSGKHFLDDQLRSTYFARRIWIDTAGNWGPTAEETIKNQNPAFTRINMRQLMDAQVDWEKLEQNISGEAARTPGKTIRAHQQTALDATLGHFKEADRGKLIMACGTGKTFTALRIAEAQTGGKGMVLFLVPSIALLGQTLREWTADAKEPIHPICVCSDADVSKKKSKATDADSMSVVDLAAPASTNPDVIAKQLKAARKKDSGLTVIFSTYQSIQAVANTQAAFAKEAPGQELFDLIICDEAHRTAGYAQPGEDESAFVKVHDNDFIKGKKRLYMTATPKLYSDTAKSKAAQTDVPVWSMDDATFYGEEIHRIGFGEAVEKGLLTEYKVLVLTIDENDMDPVLQKSIAEDNEIKSDDLSKLVGCINALSKKLLGDAGILKAADPEPMRRAVAFCPTIKDSKKISRAFNDTNERYIPTLEGEKQEGLVRVATQHVDGTMGANKRDQLLGWLKDTPQNSSECRILTNVRCLSEGVDVPSLDAVLFISAKNSEVDVVQSVGRVMRTAPGKKYGYIIIPVVVPSFVEADKALDDNERYKVVWTVLNALRAHDDRFNATVNKIELNKKKPAQILIGRPDSGRFSSEDDFDDNTSEDRYNYKSKGPDFQRQMELEFEKLQDVLFARMVLKVGSKRYWEQWAANVAEIAERQVERIHRIIAADGEHRTAFEQFLKELQQNINPGISKQQAIEMLSQHVITKPVFEALFEGYSFVEHNPISVSMQQMLDLLEAATVAEDAAQLQKFYDSVRTRAAGIDNAEGKQRVIIELYDKFFKTAFPKMVEQLGIVYTPVEVVDFIIHSVADVLEQEFGRSISDENVHILDPFTGTGTFVTRLIQSGRIQPKDLYRKYKEELHANEIVLLAYYIAAVNIENAFHDAMAEALDAEVPYEAFEGICLTDTFQLGETEAGERLFSEMFPQNSERVARQKKAPLRVIIGNPPYSVGQKSANDNAQNHKYARLDARISNTYAAATSATNKNSLYDSYIKAFRWSSDRLDPVHGGVICFVSNGAWIDGNSQDGFRKHLEQEFSSIYVFNLRGNQRTSGELSRKEGGKIFGSGSRTPIAITLLIKNPAKKTDKATIYYHDIGDYLSREEKLAILKKFGKVSHSEMLWQLLQPNDSGDWIGHRNDVFGTFIPIGDKDDAKGKYFFNPFYSRGLASARDAWCYNSSKAEVAKNISSLIEFYNGERIGFHKRLALQPQTNVEDYIAFNSSRITWNRGLKNDLERNKEIEFDSSCIVQALYRPFTKQSCYFNRALNDMVYQMPKLFPSAGLKNIVICASARYKDGSVLLSDSIPDLHLNGDTQCFPLYYYEPREVSQSSLFDANAESEYTRRDGISDFILQRAHKQYGKTVTKEDIFYYVYGILHSPQYRETFAADLKKMLPRLPLVEEPRDFWKFSKAGRELADLHLNYERVPAYKGVTVTGDEGGNYRVEKMRFPKKGEKSSIIYNSRITISNIPDVAYEYVVNGKSAIEWIMERYAITTHKDSGITNDPNDWAKEVGNPRYILDLLLSIINVSVQTVEIVKNLPELKLEAASNLDDNREEQVSTDTISLTPNTDELLRSYKHDQPIYGIEDVSYILRLPRAKARRWLEELYNEHQFNGIAPDTQTKGSPLRISFYGLIELAAIKDLRDNKIPLSEILFARKELINQYNTKFPFAKQEVLEFVVKAGRKLIQIIGEGVFKDLGGSNQLNLAFIQEFFKQIEFEAGLARRLRPVGIDKSVIVDPAESGGRAYVASKDGTAIWVEQIVSTYRKYKDKAHVEKLWNIPENALEDSLAFIGYSEAQN